MIRQCKKCSTFKNIDQFSKDSSRNGIDGKDRYCKECKKQQKSNWSINNPNWDTNYKSKNKKKIQSYCKKYNQRDEVKQKRREKDKLRKLDINKRIHGSFFFQMRRALKGNKNYRKLMVILNYSIEDLKLHIEKLWTEGMSWDNYGLHGWHIDHIIPQSWFEYISYDDEEFKKCWALENLQPKWADLNWSKNNRFAG